MSATKRPLLIFGPSGSGKSTLIRMLFEAFPDSFGYSVSHTTRLPRDNETDGVHYHFTDLETMNQAIADGKFIETTVYGENVYGTSWEAVESVKKQGRICVLDVDVEGVKQIKEKGLNPWCVFLKPTSIEVLEGRLRRRGSETVESLNLRLQVASEEVEFGSKPENFDLVIVSDKLEDMFRELKEFVVQKVFGGTDGDGEATETV